MVNWSPEDNRPPIVWTERGLRVRLVARWITATLLAVAFAVASTHWYGV